MPENILDQAGAIVAAEEARDQEKEPKCPLYGFCYQRPYLFMGSGGNQCPLMLDGCRLCSMEVRGERPDLGNCSLNRSPSARAVIHALIETGTFFPRSIEAEEETFPEGGIPGTAWYERIIGEPFPEFSSQPKS